MASYPVLPADELLSTASMTWSLSLRLMDHSHFTLRSCKMSMQA